MRLVGVGEAIDDMQPFNAEEFARSSFNLDKSFKQRSCKLLGIKRLHIYYDI